ncbi:MAG: EscU/YscU/HrcU family type III secretion system export apparatus switch protein [Gemmatimonadota bacterium]
MAGREQERTEAPTQKRRDEAHDEGRVPRSSEMATSFALLGGGMLFKVLGAVLGAQLIAIFAVSLQALGGGPLDTGSAVNLLRAVGARSLLVAGGWGVALMLIALAVAGPQARGVLSIKPITPDFSRLSPLVNARRILGIQSSADLVKSLLKLALISFAVHRALGGAWDDIMSLSQQSGVSLLMVLRTHVVGLLLTAGACYLALAALDYCWQMWRHEQSLRMSRHELQEELRQTDGDPLVRQRMRSVARALARKQMMKAVPGADVVITNPTHIAVALRYDPLRASAPVVVAIGQRKIAERIKAIARQHGVPCIENRPLARALLASARLGQLIPGELYAAVAEVLAFVIRRRMLRGSPLPALVT